MQNAWIISGQLAKSKAYCTALPELLSKTLANCIPIQGNKKFHRFRHVRIVATERCAGAFHYSIKNRHYRFENAQKTGSNALTLKGSAGVCLAKWRFRLENRQGDLYSTVNEDV